jgi:hypothetical protein
MSLLENSSIKKKMKEIGDEYNLKKLDGVFEKNDNLEEFGFEEEDGLNENSTFFALAGLLEIENHKGNENLIILSNVFEGFFLNPFMNVFRLFNAS